MYSYENHNHKFNSLSSFSHKLGYDRHNIYDQKIKTDMITVIAPELDRKILYYDIHKKHFQQLTKIEYEDEDEYEDKDETEPSISSIETEPSNSSIEETVKEEIVNSLSSSVENIVLLPKIKKVLNMNSLNINIPKCLNIKKKK